jgi:tripartite-type tricarboxylate transporter receptor subunit TctC
MITRRSFATASLTALATRPLLAQTYPERPVLVIIPYPAGNAIDVLSRLMLENLARRLGPRFVVDNRSGAGGNLGTGAAARAMPDGYTLLISASGPLAVNVSLFKNLPYDPVKDFEPVGLFASTPNVLVVHNELGVDSVAEFIKLAKSQPGAINYGSVGNGSSQHVAAALFELITGVKLTHVPFRAAGDLVTGLIRGDIQASFQLIPNIQSQLEAGQMRALGVASARRLSAYSSIPTMAEAGVADYEAAAWFGMLAPKGTPKLVVERLSTTLEAVMADEALRNRFNELGAEPVSVINAAFGSFIRSEIAKWRGVIGRAEIKP